MKKLSRRELLKWGSLAPFAANAAGAPRRSASVAEMRFEAMEAPRLAFIGVGNRGAFLAETFCAMPQVRVTAVCDVVQEKTERASARLVRAGRPAPELYHSTDRAFELLLRREDIDLVVIATPWKWHVPMAVAGMKAGKHVAVEVPAARTIEDCWTLVNTSERTRRHCVQLENCCYGYNELLALNMVRAGIFGELTHAACGYNHDLRAVLFSNGGEGLWRRAENEQRNGNLYPTHGLGPVANYLDINRGDRFDYMVSMSSLSASLQAYRKEKVPPGDPKHKEVYRKGDHNVSLIRTTKGRLITLEHNVATPQPYDRINLVAGTKGIFRDYPPRVHIDGGRDEYSPIDAYKAQYEHAYWKRSGEVAKKLGGHGGMDFIMAWRLIECMRQGAPPDMDVYDAASWSAPGPLSELSVLKRGQPVAFPDFTRGDWRSRPPAMPV